MLTSHLAVETALDERRRGVVAEGKFVSYLRVSTARQGRSGLGLEAQRQAVTDWLDGGRWKLVKEFKEVESGKHADRPELEKALQLCRVAGAKLVIAKLDRLSRNLAFITALMESGVEFVAVDNPHANKLTVHILAVMAEHDREQISERTKAALAAAKRRGVKLGGDRGARLTAKQRAMGRAASEPIVKELQASGAVTLRAIVDGLNERGIPAARGGQWRVTQVVRLLETIDNPFVAAAAAT
jgi:DNA invertase Pin-like site-specific DNA recombinase